MKGYAADLGLDTEKFDECLDSGRYAPLVQAHQKEAYQIGFRGTPSFTINGQPMVGPPSYEVLKGVIGKIPGNS